jgi:hypothetical protein
MWLPVGSVIPGLKYLEGVYNHVVTGALARGMTPATPLREEHVDRPWTDLRGRVV